MGGLFEVLEPADLGHCPGLDVELNSTLEVLRCLLLHVALRAQNSPLRLARAKGQHRPAGAEASLPADHRTSAAISKPRGPLPPSQARSEALRGGAVPQVTVLRCQRS